MKQQLSFKITFDTVCVALKSSDGTLIAMDIVLVENEMADNA